MLHDFSNVIAIDGPAASGKGTLAKTLATKLDYALLDTGKLYRAVGNLTDFDQPLEIAAIDAVSKLKSKLKADPDYLKIPALLDETVGEKASKVAVFQDVRDQLYDLQRDFALSPPQDKQGAILDGRDIGTIICPEAAVKFFITASAEIRAERRFKELQARGMQAIYAEILEDVRRRDARDQNREQAPLKPAVDAVLIDSSNLTPDEVVHKALAHISNKI